MEAEERKEAAPIEDEDDQFDLDPFDEDGGFATQKFTNTEELKAMKQGPGSVVSDSSDLRPTSAPASYNQPPAVEVEAYKKEAMLPRKLARLLDTMKNHSNGVYKDYVAAIEVQCFKLNDEASQL